MSEVGGAFPDEVHDALSAELEQLTGSSTFRVVEFAADAATVFQITRDEHGTPTGRYWTLTCEDGAFQGQWPDWWTEAAADPDLFYRRVAPKFMVRTPGRLPARLSGLLPGPTSVPVYQCRRALRELWFAAVKESPLVLGYELAVLKRVPAGRAGAQRLTFTGHPLFHPGDTQGSETTIRLTVEPTDGEGTAFVVVTREERPDLPPQDRRMRPLQVSAAMIPPGHYVVTAVLARPGHVKFRGLPGRLTESRRSWADLQGCVPDRLTAQPPVHLVCLVELCGSDDRLRQRIERLEDLVTEAQRDTRQPRVSVVSYRAHGVAWRVDDHPPKIHTWASSGDAAVEALHGLAGRQVDEREYQGAAQLECALRLLRMRLAPEDGRPAIVTAGGRLAHPPGLDTAQRLIPCPEWVDGMAEFRWLRRVPGITFGTLRDPECHGSMWEQLGRDAAATVDDAVDMENFTARLGLPTVVQTVPFPVLEQ